MSQHDMTISNQTASAARTDMNNALQALASTNSGGTAPSPTFANQLWYDTATDLLKIRNEANSAWITIGTLDQTGEKFVVSGDNLVKSDADKSLTAGYASSADNDGTISSGTYTPTYVGGNMKRIVNGGAFTLAAPTVAGDFTLVIQVTNDASAGAITVTGFSRTSGDTITTTSGDDFVFYITKINGFKTLHVQALQ